jgi:nucleotide-binding universal stress UspA family protein
MFRKILVPLDGSGFSEAVLPMVKDIAEPGAEIDVLRVATLQMPYYAETPLNYQDLFERDRRECLTYADAVAASLRQEGLNARSFVEEGLAADTILNFADRGQIDLIAMATHGQTGLTRWLLGSVADKVSHAAHVPVLLVRPEPPAGG